MKLLNERNQVLDVVKSWSKQYVRSRDDKFSRDGEFTTITKRLKGLDLQIATADDVAAIIGNTSWVGPNSCSECGKKHGTLFKSVKSRITIRQRRIFA
jgi:hypothetical protein